MKKEVSISLAIVLIIILAAAGYFYWKGTTKPPQEEVLDSVSQNVQGALDSVTNAALPSINTQTNPLEDVPTINPVSKTNPFSDIKTNPFK
mgnify:CR=1 FL=1